MATDTRPEASPPGGRPYHLSVDQFHSMIEAEIFPEGSRLELLGGILVAKANRTAAHDFMVGALGDEIRRLIPADWFVREEKPITIGKRSRPEPDLAVVRGPRSLYAGRPPTQKESGLVVEVSETTYAIDRGDRWRVYATARIPSYWIVNLTARRVEVYGDPIGRARDAAYRRVETYGLDASVPVTLDGREFGQIPVAGLLV